MAGTPKPIGRILIIPKGNYDPSTPYNSLDLVRYDFKSWLCKTDGIIGITPTEGTDWTLMTEDGTDGRGIVDIQRTGTDPSNPLKDIYTITYTDGTTSTFTVTNGSGGGTTADTMLKSVYDKDDDGIVDKADAANTATNATDATNAKNLKKSDGTIVDADTITTKLSKLNSDGTLDYSNVNNTPTIPDVSNKIDKPLTANEGQVLTYNGTDWVAKNPSGGGIAYSTNEKKTDDIWIDGKPIYRKTVTSNVDKPTSIPLDLPNVKSIIKINATCRYGEGYQLLPIVSNQLSFQTVFYYDASAKAVKFAWGSGLTATVSDIIMTFEYTKTTD